jgi:hypothetical protein
MEAKRDSGFLPRSMVNAYNRRIDEALDFLDVVHEADCVSDPRQRARALDALGDEIEARNHEVLFSGVMNQALPINRDVGGRWFDELGWPVDVLDVLDGAGRAGGDGARRALGPPHGRHGVGTTRGTLPMPPSSDP